MHAHSNAARHRLTTPDNTDTANRSYPALSRRAFIGCSVATTLSTFVMGKNAFASTSSAIESPEDQAQKDIRERVEHILHEPLSLRALDAFGVICFSDAMHALIAKKDSVAQEIFMALGLPTYNTGELDHSRGHKEKFPLENVHLAATLNIIRASAFGQEVREHTFHEFITTLQGVALLMGLTSVARGILTASHASEIAEAHEQCIGKDPEKTIADCIFQLTMVAAATQIPLTSFGNAAIGNREFREVRLAFETIYVERLLPREPQGMSRDGIIAHIESQLAQCNNPVVRKRVKRVLRDGELESHEQFASALKEESVAHTHDLMTLLMATACDDAQAAAGDPGPLIGLFQMFGPDFIHVIPTLIPFTTYIGVERALLAAKRAGIQRPIITKDNLAYLVSFTRDTWENLLKYFATAAPKISSKIAGTGRSFKPETRESTGVDFSFLEQVLRDAESAIMAVLDAVMGNFDRKTLETRGIYEAIGLLQESNLEWKSKVGELVAERIFPLREEATQVTKEEVIAIQHAVLGAKAPRTKPYSKDSTIEELNDLQIELSKLAATPDQKAIEEFAAQLEQIKKDHGPELQQAIYESLKEQGERPTIVAAAKVMKDNPRIKDILDFNYWHDRIGPALTDTMFVVLLQGLHIPFLISTAELVMYKTDWFRNLPLLAQEELSIVLNYVLGMFADNWADTVAHSKWLSTLYFGQLDKELSEALAAYPEAREKLESDFYHDDARKKIPERFMDRIDQTAALIDHLTSLHPADAEKLKTVLQTYLVNARGYYCKNMVIAMEVGVIGAGNSLPGDSTHFTYAAGQKDFTFAVTLADFKRHPLFHVYKLLFSSAYAIYIGPAIAQLLGGGALNDIQARMQAVFEARHPGFEEKFRELRKSGS